MRIHALRFAWQYAEERGVELVHPVDKTRIADVGLAGRSGIRVVHRIHIPAGRRYLTDSIVTAFDETPQIFRMSNSAGGTAGQTNHGDWLLGGDDPGLQLLDRRQ